MRRLVVPTVLALTACGGQTYCERASDLLAKCDTLTSTDISSCEDATVACTSEDQDILNDWLDCLDDAGLLECDSSSSSSTSTGGLYDAFVACYTPLAGLSSGCAGSTYSTTYTYTYSSTYSTPTGG